MYYYKVGIYDEDVLHGFEPCYMRDRSKDDTEKTVIICYPSIFLVIRNWAATGFPRTNVNR